jgi:GMP synthase (glutamine-hydrolysing)
MRCLAIVHQPDAGPGVFAEAMAARGVELDRWMIAETGEPPADPFGYDAVMTFGGAMHPVQDDLFPWMPTEKELLRELLERDMPLLGACLGSQLLGGAAAAEPQRASEPEIGWLDVELTAEGLNDPLLAPLAPGFTGFQWHSYAVPLPPGAVALARSPVCLQAWRVGERAYGIQFHAEVAAADAAHWIDDYEVDPDALAMGFDPAAMHAETEPRMEAWNQLGRELCGRFLDLVVTERRVRRRAPGQAHLT